MAVLGQRSHHDVGDVIGVDERLLHIADRQRNTACENLIEPGALTEVLREEGSPHDRPVQPARLDDVLGACGLDLVAAGQQHQPVDPCLDGALGESANGVDRAGDGQIGVIGDVDLVDAREGGRPGLRVLPVERDVRRARALADRDAASFELVGDTLTGLAGAADDENGVVGCVGHTWNSTDRSRDDP